MDKILFSLILIAGLLSFTSESKDADPFKDITICHGTFTSMAQFSQDPAFISLHPSPGQIDFIASGEMIKFDTPDGKKANAYFLRAENSESNDWLFVYQEWWGLNDQIKLQAEKFYSDLEKEVNVIALDMYDGKVTSNPQEAGTLMRSAEESRLEAIVTGAKSFAGNQARIANVGWCFGGGWSLKSALLTGEQNIGSVMYYGMPVQDIERLKTLNADVLGLFATEEYISKDIIEQFASDMQSAGKELTYKIFPAAHGFANPSNPRHDEKATAEAYAMTMEYLKRKFKG